MKLFFYAFCLSTITLATNESCPSGFSKLGKLGCIQSKMEGQSRCIDAIKHCFKAYEGRLPSFSEMVAGLTTGIDAELKYEWVDSSSISTSQLPSSGMEITYRNCGLIATKSSTPLAEVHYNKTMGFRCFIPNS